MVPHHDRSGVVIEPWLTDQWFCDARVLAAPAIAAVEDGRTRFVPRQWESTFFEWLRNIQPWCISRQMWWGHRIPAWYAPDGTVFVAEADAEASAQAAAKFGRPVALVQDEDVLDTWFSSALWPFSTLGWPDATPELARYYPGDVLVTGFDIIFFWVARMMMMGLHFMGEVPFRTVYIHALVRDERGQKMSKSRGNIIDPLELIDRYGCDALRFTLSALAAPGRDVKLAESRVEGYRNFATKLWNAARYAQMNGCRPVDGFSPATARLTVNRWIAAATADCAGAVTAALDAYRFDDAADAALPVSCGAPSATGISSSPSRSCKAVMPTARPRRRRRPAGSLGRIVHLLHPIMPFITEELWPHLGGRRRRHADHRRMAGLPTPELFDRAAAAEMEWVVEAISAVRAVRSEMNVPAAARVPLLLKDAEPTALERIERHHEHFIGLARLDRIEPAPDTVPAGAASRRWSPAPP